jgi:hypothetical protein
MATEEISEADTILEEQVEDVGEVELEREERAAPRRATAIAPARVEAPEAEVGLGWLVAMVATSLVMLLSIPVCFSASSGDATGLAKGIAGLFGAQL